jgi:hypothetical protein
VGQQLNARRIIEINTSGFGAIDDRDNSAITLYASRGTNRMKVEAS